jgi:hypothetical protein
MAEVKRVEAKITLQKNDDGHWLVVDAPSGKHAIDYGDRKEKD